MAFGILTTDFGGALPYEPPFITTGLNYEGSRQFQTCLSKQVTNFLPKLFSQNLLPDLQGPLGDFFTRLWFPCVAALLTELVDLVAKLLVPRIVRRTSFAWVEGAQILQYWSQNLAAGP